MSVALHPRDFQCIELQSATVQSMRQPTLTDIMTEAAAGPRIQEYLAERGIRTTATLALLSKDEDGVDRTPVQPLLQGWPKADGSKIEVPAAEHPIVKAIMLHMWMVAKRSMQAAMAQSAQPIAPASTPSTAGSSSTAAEDKVPKTMPDTPWEPRSLLAILDGLSSVKWAFILAAIAPERAVVQFFDWMVKLCRSRPNKTDQLGQFYRSTSWRLATAMRSGSTFEEATAVIMKDFDSFSECMGREPVQKATKPAPSNQDRNKGSGKSNTKSKGLPQIFFMEPIPQIFLAILAGRQIPAIPAVSPMGRPSHVEQARMVR